MASRATRLLRCSPVGGGGTPAASSSSGGSSITTMAGAGKPQNPPPPPPQRQKKKSSEILRVDEALVEQMFHPSHRRRWPRGYTRPAASVAHFTKSAGVPFRDLVDARMDIRDDQRNELQRELSHEYGLYSKQQLETFFLRCREDGELGRLLRRVSQRDRLPRGDDVRKLFGIEGPANSSSSSSSSTPAAAAPTTTAAGSPAAAAAAATGTSSGRPPPPAYTSYARAQEHAMRPVEHVSGPDALVHLHGSFPALRNVLHCEYDSLSPLRCYSLLTGDPMPYTREFVASLAADLCARVDALGDAAAGRPILCLFGNGRLAAMLNAMGLLPPGVTAVAATMHAGPAGGSKPSIRDHVMYCREINDDVDAMFADADRQIEEELKKRRAAKP